MTNGRTILVPLDGSALSEAALPAAATVAERLAAGIELLTVTPDAAEWGVEAVVGAFGPSEDFDEWIEGYLQARSSDLAEVADRRVTFAVRSGVPRDAVLEFARESEPLAIVMATHGRGPLTRAWMGSVADTMLREGPAPVVLVRPEDDNRGGVPDLTSTPDFRCIVVPVDGSGQGAETLGWAMRLGSQRTSYYLVQVVAMPIAHAAGPMVTAADWLPGMLVAARAEAEAYLEEVVGRFRERGMNLHTEVVQDGLPAPGILHFAEEHNADLIAIGTHGRGGLSRAVLGSVADKVVRGAYCPVLVVPRPSS
jgi:nucleotide-binding universal stress UspA family protein